MDRTDNDITMNDMDNRIKWGINNMCDYCGFNKDCPCDYELEDCDK